MTIEIRIEFEEEKDGRKFATGELILDGQGKASTSVYGTTFQKAGKEVLEVLLDWYRREVVE